MRRRRMNLSLSGKKEEGEVNELEATILEARKLNLKIWELEEKERTDKLWPIWKKRHNTYWKFKNSYSCPETESDYWYMYRRITNPTPDGRMDAMEFQICRRGILSVQEHKDAPWMLQTDGWVPSTEAEWKKAAAAAGEMVGKLSKRS